MRQDEKEEWRENGKQWKSFVAEKRSQGELETVLGTHGFDHRILEIYARAGLVAGEDLPVPGRISAESDEGGQADGWSETLDNDELNSWTVAKLKKSHYQARQEDDQRKSIVQRVVTKSTDFLRRIIAPVEGQGGYTVVRVLSFGKNNVTGGALHAAASTTGGTESWVYMKVRAQRG